MTGHESGPEGTPARPTECHHLRAGLGARLGGVFGELDAFAFGEEETAEGAEVVQDAAAGGDMEVEFGEVIGDQEEGLLAAVGVVALGGGDFGFDFAARLGQGFRQEGDVLVRALDAIKRRFRRVPHGMRLSGQPISAGGLHGPNCYIFA